MALSRKHYVAVAAVLNTAAQDAADQSGPHTVEQIVNDLADLFAADNPNFDRARFLTASFGSEWRANL